MGGAGGWVAHDRLTTWCLHAAAAAREKHQQIKTVLLALGRPPEYLYTYRPLARRSFLPFRTPQLDTTTGGTEEGQSLTGPKFCNEIDASLRFFLSDAEKNSQHGG